jgi:peptidylprolyl isomerase domain and WD repeat-containing protein 1
MHKEEISCIAGSIAGGFIATGSTDGILKFWKKNYKGIEFAKQYRAHVTAVSCIVFSQNGLKMASISASEPNVKIYDTLSLDMIDKLNLKENPVCIEMGSTNQHPDPVLIISTASGLFKCDLAKGHDLNLLEIHSGKVLIARYSPAFHSFLTVDDLGMIEIWDADSSEVPSHLKFKSKLKTDLYHLAKNKEYPLSLSLSPNGLFFCLYTSCRTFHVFEYLSGNLLLSFPEHYKDYQELQNDIHFDQRLERIEFFRRMALEKEIDKTREKLQTTWDETSTYLLYSSYIGIKIIQIPSGELIQMIGKEETPRFTSLFLFQGQAMLNTSGKAGMGGSSSQGLKEFDPILFALGFHRSRFYLFTQRNPVDEGTHENRDVMNETLQEIEKNLVIQPKASVKLATSVVIHTTMGDIAIKLMGKYCPKTVENFTGHCLSGFYNQQIFHRVVKNFMIQTGDPEGNGHGGCSIWGGEFEDEILEELKHDRPFTVSMANRGPNSNGSQFFITTVAASWLNGKHTLFGRVTRGMDTVIRIEGVPCDKKHKPKADVRIIDITTNFD